MEFTLLALVVVVAVLAVLYEVDTCGTNYGRYGERYKWNCIVNKEVNVTEDGFVKNGSDHAGIKSWDGASEKHITTALIFYDYANSTFIIILYQLEYPCLLFKTILTFNEVKQKIAANNGTNVYGLPKLKLDGTTLLTSDEEKVIIDKSRDAKMYCRNRRISRTVTTTVDPDKASNTTEITVVGLEAEYLITVSRRLGS